MGSQRVRHDWRTLLSLRTVKLFSGDHCFEKSHTVYFTEKGQYYFTWQDFVWVEMHHSFILKDYELIWSIYGYWWYDYCTRIKNSELWWTVAWEPFSLVFIVLSNSFLRHKTNKEWKKWELFMDCCVIKPTAHLNLYRDDRLKVSLNETEKVPIRKHRDGASCVVAERWVCHTAILAAGFSLKHVLNKKT